jgi:hypothetical protein
MNYPDLNTSTDCQLRAFCRRVDPNGSWYASDEPDGTDATRAECVAVIRAWAAEDGFTI